VSLKVDIPLRNSLLQLNRNCAVTQLLTNQISYSVEGQSRIGNQHHRSSVVKNSKLLDSACANPVKQFLEYTQCIDIAGGNAFG
jgi:hypothetical protein